MSKGRGRPRGSGKPFSTDPDRYVIAMVDALLATGVKFEHAAMFAIYVHHRDQIDLPGNPLHSARRLGLSAQVQEHLRKGWRLQQWGPAVQPNRDIGGQVDRIRKKRQRFAAGIIAARWRYYMALAWASLLNAPSLDLVEAGTREAGELRYFETVMLPFGENAAGN
jgi:hypothetical protein